MNALMQCESTRGAHAKFSYLDNLYGENLELAEKVDDYELQVPHRVCFEVFPPNIGWHVHFFGQKCNLCRCDIP